MESQTYDCDDISRFTDLNGIMIILQNSQIATKNALCDFL